MCYVRKWCIVGNPHFLHILVIDYGYWLELLTISLENSKVFCFPSELRFILLQNIVNILNCFPLLLGATYTVTKTPSTLHRFQTKTMVFCSGLTATVHTTTL